MKKYNKRATTSGILSILALCAGATVSMAADTVNVYSYRQAELIQPMLDAFTEQTGIATRILFGAKGLDQRILSEGRNSPADVLLTTDIGRLDAAKQMGITQPVKSAVLKASIPEQFRDEDGNWFGLTLRARVIYASRERVKQQSITYKELADPKWKGKVCTRSGQHVYSLGLIASMIANMGEEKAEQWLKGVKDNLASKPTGNDRAQVKAVYSGQCDIALGNTYYMGKMETNEKDPEQKDWAKSVHLLFPDAEGRGTHVNLAGMVLAKHAPHREEAIKLMEFLASAKAQQLYAKANFEYPVTPGIEADTRVASWGALKADTLKLSDIAKLRKAASEMVDRVGFDDGPDS